MAPSPAATRANTALDVSATLAFFDVASTRAPLGLKSRAIQPAPAAATDTVTGAAWAARESDVRDAVATAPAEATGTAAPTASSAATRLARAARRTGTGMKVLSRLLDPGEG